MFTVTFFKKTQFIHVMFTDLGKVLGNDGKTEVNKILTELSLVGDAIKQWDTIQWGKGYD